MQRFAFAFALLSSLAVGVRPAAAGDGNYRPAYPVGYPAPYQQNDHEVLKKVLIGGALVGLGFLAGRLTAPKPHVQPYSVQPQFVPQYGPQFSPHGPRSAGFRSPQFPHSHRF